MWFALHHVEHLSVPEESKQTLLKHILEYEIFVVITHLKNVTKNYVVNGCFPLSVLIGKVSEIVNLLLGDVSVKNLLVDSASEGWWHSSFGILHKEGLVVLLKKSLSDENSFIDETFFFINTDLAKGHIELIELSSQIVQASGL